MGKILRNVIVVTSFDIKIHRKKSSRPCDTNLDDDVNSFCLAFSPAYIAFAYVPLFSYVVLAASFRARSCVTSVNRTRRRGMWSFPLFFFFHYTLESSCSIFVLSRSISILYISTANAVLLSFPASFFSRSHILFTIFISIPHSYDTAHIQYYLSSFIFSFFSLRKILDSSAKFHCLFALIFQSCYFFFFFFRNTKIIIIVISLSLVFLCIGNFIYTLSFGNISLSLSLARG